MTDADEIIFTEGQQAYENGEADSSCPYADARERRLWHAGWDEARRYKERFQSTGAKIGSISEEQLSEIDQADADRI